MRDLAFVGFLIALLGLGFRRPFLFVLAYAYVDIVAPQHLSYFLLNSQREAFARRVEVRAERATKAFDERRAKEDVD